MSTYIKGVNDPSQPGQTPGQPGRAPSGSTRRPTTPSAPGASTTAADVNTAPLDAVAWLLDDIVRIPGINLRLGLDAVIGLIPGVGDALGTALGSVILIGSVRHRVPLRVLVHMSWNLLLDTLLGLIPGVGDVADAAHRAHRKNYVLLRRAIDEGQQVQADTRGYALRAIALVAVVIALMVAAMVATVWLLAQGLGALAG